MDFDKSAIQEVLEVARRMDEKNLVNAYEGNISVRKDGLIYITPTTKNKGILTEDMIAVIDEKGKQVGGSCKHTSELIMHFQTYRIRDDIGGVVHCHAPYMTAYALCCKNIETRSYPEMMGNFGLIECAPYGRPGTDGIIKAAVPILQKKRICLLGNHGVLAVGATATDAMNITEACEAITRVIYLSERVGKPVDLPDTECEHFFSLCH